LPPRQARDEFLASVFHSRRPLRERLTVRPGAPFDVLVPCLDVGGGGCRADRDDPWALPTTQGPSETRESSGRCCGREKRTPCRCAVASGVQFVSELPEPLRLSAFGIGTAAEPDRSGFRRLPRPVREVFIGHSDRFGGAGKLPSGPREPEVERPPRGVQQACACKTAALART